MAAADSVVGLLELAISREIQAAQFYKEVAGTMANPVLRAIFEQLGEEELEHKSRLELEMMKEGAVARTVGRLVDVEPADYTEEFRPAPEVGFKEALAVVIEKERRSFRLYADMARIVPDAGVREALLQLAEEEARHMVRFEREYEKLTANEK
jgi:rubrerythrin